MALHVSPCRTLCDWRPTRASGDAGRLFACTGCGSQWQRGEPWAPRQADGTWPPGVREELGAADEVNAARGGGAGSAGSWTSCGP